MFALWSPVLLDNRMACRFDVTPNDFDQLSMGTQELMVQFLADLHIDADPLKWHIDPFCSPYYSNDSNADSWRDRYPMAWRVQVDFTRPCRAMNPTHIFGPHTSHGVDATWEESLDEDDWDWSNRVCVVIADYVADDWHDTHKTSDREPAFGLVRRIDAVQLTPTVVQGRFDMGLLLFPADQDKVEHLVQSCYRDAFSVNWATSLHHYGSGPMFER